MSTPTAQLQAAAKIDDTSLVATLARLLLGPLAHPDRPGARHTLLAVCPNSEAVARAALLAAQEANTPLLYAATLNQVDRNGGYTGWTPSSFAAFVQEETKRLDLDVPVILGLDHGGPWRKDAHARRGLDLTTTMEEVKRSIRACITAGYELLHLDATTPHPQSSETPLPIDTIVDRTVELMQHAESVRRSQDRPPLAYEVGTEEESGGLQSDERVRTFLHRLDDALEAHDLPRPTFVVGDVGTSLDTPHFDTYRARRLTAAAATQMNALIKGHYTDDVDTPEQYPLSGMGGANVGPGLAAVEVDALRQLVSLESHLDADSGFSETLREAVVDSGRWTKWLAPTEFDGSFESLPADRQRWLVDTGSRYVWTHPAVTEARSQLYANVAPYRNAEAFVQWRLKTAILHYMHAFNLVDLTDHLLEALAEQSSNS